MNTPLRLAFLASHRGSNVQAILDSCARGEIAAEAVLMISNNANSTALERAARAGLHAVHLSRKEISDEDAYDETICALLVEQEIDLVVLAGYTQKIGPRVLNKFRRRILNIHPALLPKHGGQGMFGLRVHEAVLAAGDKVSGATVHLIDAEYDTGPVLAQREVVVDESDTAESLAAKVLLVEHELYSEVIRRITLGQIDLDTV